MKNRVPKEPEIVQVDMKYLCPKDPNKEAIEAAGGMVLETEGPTHLAGWITEIKDVSKKRRAFVDGKAMEWDDAHKSATWKCQTCGTEINVDPYP